LKGVVLKDHIHMRVEYHSSQDIISLVKLLKGSITDAILDEYVEYHRNPNNNNNDNFIIEN